MNRAENLARTTLQDNCITAYAITRVAFVSALLVQQYLAPATAFCAITPFHVIASSSSASLGKPSARPWPPRRSRFELFGIKRKVKVDLEENVSISSCALPISQNILLGCEFCFSTVTVRYAYYHPRLKNFRALQRGEPKCLSITRKSENPSRPLCETFAIIIDLYSPF